MTQTPMQTNGGQFGGTDPKGEEPANRVQEPQRTERRWLLPAGLVVLTLITFSPAAKNAFVNWDDDINIVYNLAFRGFAAENLRWMFSTSLGGHYQPFTWLSFAVDYAIGGMNPAVFHWTNILLHAGAALLFYFVAARLLRAADPHPESNGRNDAAVPWCAALAAAIFAVHPLRVESVAWITERRDVLSGVLLFAAVLAYLRAVEQKRIRAAWFGAALVLYAASLLSKAAGMTLPVVLLLLDAYPLRRPARQGVRWGRLAAEKAPFFALGGAAALLAAVAQQAAGAWAELDKVGLADRLFIASRGWWFYLYKLIRPIELIPLYPLPSPGERGGWPGWLAVVGIVVVLGIAWRYRRQYPAVVTALVAYGVLLAPVSGIAQSGQQFAADRYTYLSLLPFALLVAGALLGLFRRARSAASEQRKVRIFGGFSAAYVGGLALLSIAQCSVWRNSLTLWSFVASRAPDTSFVYVNLGEAYRLLNDPLFADEALAMFSKAREIDPTEPTAHNGMGIMLLALNRPQEALVSLREAVRLNPQQPKFRCNLALTLAGFGKLDEALAEYRQACAIEPTWGVPAELAGSILVRQGRYAEARTEMEAAWQRGAREPSLLGSLAWLLATCPQDEIRDGARAVELAEHVAKSTGYRDPWALDTLAAAYAEKGELAGAVSIATRALQLAEAGQHAALAGTLRERLAYYQAGQAFREKSADPAPDDQTGP